jgi:DivIVA domain-containing protein
MSDLQTRTPELLRPEFTIAIRGYDRAQVDDYIDHLLEVVADAHERARDAADEYVFDAHAAIGPRVAEIFALAEAEARDLRDSVGAQSRSLVGDARTEARTTIEKAERAAGEIRERAEREHVVMFAELEQERERIRGEVAVLERRKAEAVGELHRLREALGEVAGPPAELIEPGERGAAPQLPGPTDQTVELPAITLEPGE